MAEEKNKKIRTTAEWDERREKIRELIKERIQKNKPEGSIKKNKTRIEIQLEESNEKIKDLIEFGDELVTNITVAREMREIQRRKFEDAQKKALLDDLSKESAESMEKFNNISDKWAELKNYKEPVVMFNQLENQKESINELMRSKDSIIEKCQKEIDRMSDKYYSDQEKQAAEICLMIERVDNQVELIKQAYKNHLDLLQDAIEEERLKATRTEAEQWESLFGTLKAFEERKLNMEKERERNYMNEIAHSCKEQQEITRETRIRLERDAEALQLELRNTQNNVLMNSEKMDYNFQVLKKRNEENVIINNQQKRRLAKLKETITALKAKVETTTERSLGAVKKMSTEVGKLYTNIDHLEKKSKQFLQANEKKYQYVWSLNYQEAVSLANRIFEIDRLLHEQQLGIEWNPIHIEEINQPKTNNTGQKNIKKHKDASNHSNRKSSNTLDNKISQCSEIRLLRCILKKVSDRAGFLIEDKLIKILEPFTEEEKCLVRLDNIFDALNITEYINITSLIDYFLPYCWCPNCAKELPEETVQQAERTSTREKSSVASEKDAHESSPSSELDTWSISSDDVEHNVTKILTSQKSLDQQLQKSKGKKTCSRHYLVIKPAFVLTALRSFTENYLKKIDNGRSGAIENAAAKSSPVDRSVGRDATEKCWLTFQQALTPEKKKLWKTLEHGLDHYLFILKEREQLDMECEFLRQQNIELRHLLQKHMPSAL